MLMASQGLSYLTRDKECEFEIILGEEKNMREYSRLHLLKKKNLRVIEKDPTFFISNIEQVCARSNKTTIKED